MYPSPTRVALTLAVMLKRSGKTRARVSDKTFRLVSRRTNLRGAFVTSVREWLEDFGVFATELDRGGFALVAISALDGAPPITAKQLLPAPERKKITDEALLAELDLSVNEHED